MRRNSRSIAPIFVENVGNFSKLKIIGLDQCFLKYPLVADLSKQISKDYDVLFGEAIALRGSFLIDADKTVRHAVINDLPLGRNIDEMIRMVDTMLFTNEHGEVCPAGWQKGDEGMKATTEGVAKYLADHADNL